MTITRVMGIDPGIATTGVGVIHFRGDGQGQHMHHSCIITKAHTDNSERLLLIHHHLTQYIQDFQPHVIAVEELFFAANAKTAITVGQARGVILLTAMQMKVPVVECTPLEVKQAITGYGRSDKKQMQEMMKLLLKLDSIPHPDDAADALAIAWCGQQKYQTMKILQKNQ